MSALAVRLLAGVRTVITIELTNRDSKNLDSQTSAPQNLPNSERLRWRLTVVTVVPESFEC
jgi:hypothetical protein